MERNCSNCEYKNCIGAQGADRKRRNRKTGKRGRKQAVPNWCPLKTEEENGSREDNTTD